MLYPSDISLKARHLAIFLKSEISPVLTKCGEIPRKNEVESIDCGLTISEWVPYVMLNDRVASEH